MAAATIGLVVVCGGSGCGGASPASPTAASSQPADACAAVASSGPAPVTDPSGPYYHQVVVAHTADGITLQDAQQILDHASVPDGARRADGSILVYYVNGAEGAVWVARLDGDRATPLAPITINGVTRPRGVVDPDAMRLADGRIRLAYLNAPGETGGASVRAMCLADSTDGEHFTGVGAAVTLGSGDTTTDPSMVQLKNGGWLMAMSRGQTTVLARSSDGVTFALGETLTYGGVPELALSTDGRVRLYVCAIGIVSYISATDGATWQREATVVAPAGAARIVCDPSVVAGTDVFLYKTANP